MNKLPPQRIVFFDLETTGIDPAYHQVIQIAACAYDCTRQVIIDECEMKLAFNWLDASPTALIINSFPIGAQRAGDQEIAYAESVVVGDLPPSHGTRFDLAYMEWLKSAVSPFDAITSFAKFLKRHATLPRMSKRGGLYAVASIGGHNCQRFDIPFLIKLFKGHDKFLPADFCGIDTIVLAKAYSIQNRIEFPKLTLEYLHTALVGEIEQTHDALDDVRATVRLYEALRDGGNND